MARVQPLSELQLAILDVLWSCEEATIAAVQEALREVRELALTTVATLLSRMRARGIVARRTEGRQFVYRAAVGREDVRRSMVSALTQRLFQGDPAALVHHLLDEGGLDARELARIRRLLQRGPSGRGRSDDA